MHTLESWTVRTYEGRRVSYTIIIDLDVDSKINNSKYFSAFLKDEYSATLSNGINSAFIIDKNENLIGYTSTIDSKKHDVVKRYHIDQNSPLIFSDLIDKEITGSRVGIFFTHQRRYYRLQRQKDFIDKKE